MTTSRNLPLQLPLALRCIQRTEFPRKLGVCERLFGHALSQQGICWVPTAPGPIWKLDLKNQTHRWIVYGYYEGSGFWRWVKAHRTTLHTIVDSGANIGQTVLYFASFAPAARILAYEPGQSARDWLVECVSANALEKVRIQSTGLGSIEGQAFLANAGAEDRHGAWNSISATTGAPIEITTMDHEIARGALDTVDLWKLDMEGYELEALRGAEKSLKTGKIRAVYIEAANEIGRACCDFLKAHDFGVHGILPSGRLVPLHSSGHFDSALCLAKN